MGVTCTYRRRRLHVVDCRSGSDRVMLLGENPAGLDRFQIADDLPATSHNTIWNQPRFKATRILHRGVSSVCTDCRSAAREVSSKVLA